MILKLQTTRVCCAVRAAVWGTEAAARQKLATTPKATNDKPKDGKLISKRGKQLFTSRNPACQTPKKKTYKRLLVAVQLLARKRTGELH